MTRLTAALTWLKHLFEFMGGEREHGPNGFPLDTKSVFWGIWWGAMAGVVFIFCGQASKFIYIDF